MTKWYIDAEIPSRARDSHPSFAHVSRRHAHGCLSLCCLQSYEHSPNTTIEWESQQYIDYQTFLYQCQCRSWALQLLAMEIYHSYSASTHQDFIAVLKQKFMQHHHYMNWIQQYLRCDDNPTMHEDMVESVGCHSFRLLNFTAEIMAHRLIHCAAVASLCCA